MRSTKKNSLARFLAEWGIFSLIIIGFLLSRLFIWQPVSVDGHSMDPTLHDKERLIMARTTTIDRFDIVVASEVDSQGKEKLIVKRVIGMPGDSIRFENDALYINEEVVDEPYLAEYLAAFKEDKLQSIYSYNKSFQNRAAAATAFTLDANGYPSLSYVVPEGHYFLMGDDRLVSLDSRNVGPFTKANIKGEVVFRMWPLNRIGTVK